MNRRLHCTHNSTLQVLVSLTQKHNNRTTTHPVNYGTTQSHEPTGREGSHSQKLNSTPRSAGICLSINAGRERERERESESERDTHRGRGWGKEGGWKSRTNTNLCQRANIHRAISCRKDKKAHQRLSCTTATLLESFWYRLNQTTVKLSHRANYSL